MDACRAQWGSIHNRLIVVSRMLRARQLLVVIELIPRGLRFPGMSKANVTEVTQAGPNIP